MTDEFFEGIAVGLARCCQDQIGQILGLCAEIPLGAQLLIRLSY